METISGEFNGKKYWRKKGYTLLNEVVKIEGDGGVKRKRFWRLKKARKVVMRPNKLWSKLRDGYMKMMMKVAGDVGRLNGGNGFLGKRIAGPTTNKRVEDFETRLLLEIYKAMSTSRGISEI